MSVLEPAEVLALPESSELEFSEPLQELKLLKTLVYMLRTDLH